MCADDAMRAHAVCRGVRRGAELEVGAQDRCGASAGPLRRAAEVTHAAPLACDAPHSQCFNPSPANDLDLDRLEALLTGYCSTSRTLTPTEVDGSDLHGAT